MAGHFCTHSLGTPVPYLDAVANLRANVAYITWKYIQGASKGAAVDSILHYLAAQGNAPDFVLCIGDDRSDEDMFTAMEHVTFSPHLPAEVSIHHHLPRFR